MRQRLMAGKSWPTSTTSDRRMGWIKRPSQKRKNTDLPPGSRTWVSPRKCSARLCWLQEVTASQPQSSEPVVATQSRHSLPGEKATTQGMNVSTYATGVWADRKSDGSGNRGKGKVKLGGGR